MPSYLNDYGAEDARREKIFKRIILVAIIASVLASLFYWTFREYREKGQIKAFFLSVESGDLRAAHALWGCTESQPCKAYSFEQFLQDWGPDGEFRNVSSARLTRTRSCKTGIIQTVEFSQDNSVIFWVGRDDKNIGYAPWPYLCDPHLSPADLR